jgi:predicted acylesterase/phospholipase RssA
MTTKDKLKVYAMPVSGGALVAQLAFLCELSLARGLYDKNRSNIYPDIVLGASGGNVSAYVAMCGGWTANGIERVSNLLETKMLVTSWWPDTLNFMPTSLIGIFTGSLYRPGYGVKNVFKDLLTPKLVRSVEIWTGTFNKSRGRAHFFCNKKEGETFINSERFEHDRLIYDCESLTFTNGNLDYIAEVVVASAAIPVLVEHQVICGCEHGDGGIIYASPLSPFSSEIIRIVTGDTSYKRTIEIMDFDKNNLNDVITKGDFSDDEEEKSHVINIDVIRSPKIQEYSMQMIYFSCYDMSSSSNDIRKSYGALTGDVGLTLSSLLKSQSVMDRAKGVEIMRALVDDGTKIIHKHYHKMDTKSLAELLEDLDTKQHYFLDLYPHGAPTVNLLEFKGKDILDEMKQIRKAYGAHVWYIN